MAEGEESYIVFVDETGFMLDPLVRKTWAPRGKTPVVRVTTPHERISGIGAMTIRKKCSSVRSTLLTRLYVNAFKKLLHPKEF